MAVSMAAYVVVWRIGNKRGQRKEAERIETLRQSGYLNEKSESEDEKPGKSHEIQTM